MRLQRTVAGARERSRQERAAGRSIGLVPTMGALHDGHRSLIRSARAASDVVVVSIFVNPLQFGPTEDFSAYPRTEEADIEVCRAEDVDVVFAPTPGEMAMESGSTTITVAKLGEIIEGASRPGHFAGVCTVVAKLLNTIEPDAMWLGQKDAQQNAVIARMVSDLSFGVRLEVCPTVRAPDGVALSSRNAYLSADDRGRATVLLRALRAGSELVSAGTSPEAAEQAMLEVLSAEEGVEPDYARAVDPGSFEAPPSGRPVLLVVAARIGRARLIDNLVASPEAT